MFQTEREEDDQNMFGSDGDAEIEIESLSRLETLEMLQNLLVGYATGDRSAQERHYKELRRRMVGDPVVAGQLPSYVKTCLTLGQFWPTIQKVGGYAARREQLWNDFGAIIRGLEAAAPADVSVSDTLKALSESEVHAVWGRALERRSTDPEAAITSARTLLESTCKHILDEAGAPYDDRADLPKLYSITARTLNLAPDQHTEQIFKQILGGCHSVVDGLGAMRNRLSDAHGRGRAAVRPSARHAALAVNLSGAMATFLVETWNARRTPE